MSSKAKTSHDTAGVPVAPGRHRWVVAALLAVVVGGGAGHRAMSAWMGDALAAPIQLDPPLRSLPIEIGAWVGEEVPLSAGVLRIAGNDDYVSRMYVNGRTRERVSLYVAYTARPRTMLRHRPSVCYPSAGWTSTSVKTGDIAVDGGRHLPVRIEEFFRTGLTDQRRVVLSYYVLAGVPTIDENSFWSLGWRTPNLSRDASRYVAQIQITAPARVGGDTAARDMLCRFATETAGEILALLPGKSRDSN